MQRWAATNSIPFINTCGEKVSLKGRTVNTEVFLPHNKEKETPVGLQNGYMKVYVWQVKGQRLLWAPRIDRSSILCPSPSRVSLLPL